MPNCQICNGEWIKCSERMPDKDQLVLVYWPRYTHRPKIIDLTAEFGGRIDKNRLIQYNGNPDSLWWEHISSYEPNPPTHWMPMIKSPEEVKELPKTSADGRGVCTKPTSCIGPICEGCEYLREEEE